MDGTDLAAIVIDNGSGTIKAGIAGDEAPRAMFQTLVGKSSFTGLMVAADIPDCYFGQEAFDKRGTLSMHQPIERGLIKDWDMMEKIWHHTFYNVLKVDPQEHPSMITECPLNPAKSREKMAEIFFEHFNVRSFYICPQPVLALYANGSTKGLVLDSGEGKTHVVPVYEGYSLPHAIGSMDLAGSDLTKYLMELLIKSGMTFSRANDFHVVNAIKEKTNYIAQNYEQEVADYREKGNANDQVFHLPDGKSVNIGDQQFECPEALFNPSKMGKENMDGIHELVYRCYFKCDMEIRKLLFNNIVLSGGNTLYKNFCERLSKELKALGGSLLFKIYAPAERRYSVWIGGSVLASLSTFQAMWISKEEWDEGDGARKVQMKTL